MSHTPGPWNVTQPRGPESFDIAGDNFSEPILLAYRATIVPKEEDARLIAAAPELLEAAQTVIRDMEEAHDDAPFMEPLRAAVAKATGAEVPA